MLFVWGSTYVRIHYFQSTQEKKFKNLDLIYTLYLMLHIKYNRASIHFFSINTYSAVILGLDWKYCTHTINYQFSDGIWHFQKLRCIMKTVAYWNLNEILGFTTFFGLSGHAKTFIILKSALWYLFPPINQTPSDIWYFLSWNINVNTIYIKPNKHFCLAKCW